MISIKTLFLTLLCIALSLIPVTALQAETSELPGRGTLDDKYGRIGDPDGTGNIDIDDVTFLISYVFGSGPAPSPLCTGDADGNGGVDIDDVVYLINYIFGGAAPPAPLGPIIPRPVDCLCSDGDYVLAPADTIWVQSGLTEALSIGQYLAEKLVPATGFDIETRSAPTTPSSGIFLKLNQSSSQLGKEGYELNISSGLVTLEAYKPEGLFRGIQTIRQLFPAEIEDSVLHEGPWILPGGHIIDYPSFKWRGYLLDVVRHFFGVEMIKQYIDLLAYYKMNVLHLHLTDDQGWRTESLQYPLLNEIGSWRGNDNYGGYYTREEIHEIVDYATARYIDVVPEIEMPGHAIAAIVSYPSLMCDPVIDSLEIPETGGIYNTILCPGKDSTLDFVKGVLDEIVEMFPSSVIHIGGDEVPKDRWENCPYCQARMDSLGLGNVDELQDWFMNEISWYLYDTYGRRTSGWSEGGTCQDSMPLGGHGQWWGVGDDIAVLAANGNDVVNTYFSTMFLDRWFCTLQEIYEYDITASTDPEFLDHILGGEAALWTEYIETETEVDDKTFPRLIALAENAWSPAEDKDYIGFYTRLLKNLECLNYMGIDFGDMEE